jgi:hypothetical protein
MKMLRPEGFPDLVRVTYLGDEFLIDYPEGQVLPILKTRFSPEVVLKYMFEEGFLIPEVEVKEADETSGSDLSRN